MVIELKTTQFQPEYTGKLNFYLSAVDDLLRSGQDQPSIGILICKDKNKTVAEYALRDIHKPIGVSAYQLTQSLPDELKSIDECFATGTAAEVTAIGKIDEMVYKVGPVTRLLRDAYEKLVRAA